jgi:hypothetical protein
MPMSLELAAELVMMIEDYECEKKQKWGEGIDFTASDAKSDDKILLRLITAPKSKSGFICVDDVKEMVDRMERSDYDKGVLISKEFTTAAREELGRNGIRVISEKYMPFESKELYSKLQDCIDDLCKAKCGKVPKRKSDCRGHSDGDYSCRIRPISDDASFHFNHGWSRLLQNDLKRLLKMQKTMG